MALRRTIAKRFFNRNRDTPPPISVQKTAARNVVNRDTLTGKTSFLGRFLHRRSNYQQSANLPEFLLIPLGVKLRERLWPSSIAGNRIHLDEFVSPENIPAKSLPGVLDAGNLKKLYRAAQLEKVRAKLMEISVNAISYAEFLDVCIGVCGNREQGLERARLLDDAGNVVVLGNIVFLRPDQVAKAMEKLIYQFIAIPNDPRKEELEQMKTQKAQIDNKAEALVRRELYCGLGFLVIQTMGFMRLTFWELSWDVMEPICFFVTSLHFALAYAFFIRTSKEPTFEGYFQRRFKVKQAKLMKTHSFDFEKYEELCRAFYPKNVDEFNHIKNLGANVVI